MTRIKLFSLIVFSFSLMSCNTDNWFSPPPYSYKKWIRPNTTALETQKIMIECGYPTPDGEGFNTEPNKIALMHLCMERNSFKYIGDFGRYCDRYPTLPACIEAAAAKKVR